VQPVVAEPASSRHVAGNQLSHSVYIRHRIPRTHSSSSRFITAEKQASLNLTFTSRTGLHIVLSLTYLTNTYTKCLSKQPQPSSLVSSRPALVLPRYGTNARHSCNDNNVQRRYLTLWSYATNALLGIRFEGYMHRD
jgi:hypothetical protein